MFTGIVQGVGTVAHVERLSGLHRLRIAMPDACAAPVNTGASVAINGVCLTVVAQSDQVLSFDVMQETLSRTGLATLHSGQRVNVERAARFGDEIGGHLLSGHVHAQAQITRVECPENNRTLHLRLAPEWLRYVFPKGFIAINGASLTVGTVDTDGFTVHLIPETLRATTFAELREGDLVNIEIDSQTQVIVDTLERMGLSPNRPQP
ncbi:MAG: riboflavin synthase subunit alpha [Gammaproteobacteria bacterium]|nr:riboflavin synthase subunit alpha [Gammaproteobacteria bacterium]